jgi:hypothetical protein
MNTTTSHSPKAVRNPCVEIEGRSNTACSADFQGRQASRGGDGLIAGPLESKRSAQASGMEAHRARRHRRLDAQHDSAARHRRGTHGNPWNLQCVFTQNLRNTKPPSRICVNPQNRAFVKAALCPCMNANSLICVKSYIRKPVNQQNRPNVKSPQHTAGQSLAGVHKTPRRKAGRQGDGQSPLLRDQIRLCVPSSASTSRA